MSGIKITRVLAEDWQGVYVDDRLEVEGHSIPDFDWINLIRKHFHEDLQDETIEVNQEWLEERLGLPTNLRDVKRGD